MISFYHYYQKALDISPDFEKVIVNLAIVRYKNKEYQKALTLLNKRLDSKDKKFKKVLLLNVKAYTRQKIKSLPKNLQINVIKILKQNPSQLAKIYIESQKVDKKFIYFLRNYFN